MNEDLFYNFLCKFNLEDHKYSLLNCISKQLYKTCEKLKSVEKEFEEIISEFKNYENNTLNETKIDKNTLDNVIKQTEKFKTDRISRRNKIKKDVFNNFKTELLFVNLRVKFPSDFKKYYNIPIYISDDKFDSLETEAYEFKDKMLNLIKTFEKNKDDLEILCKSFGKLKNVSKCSPQTWKLIKEDCDKYNDIDCSCDNWEDKLLESLNFVKKLESMFTESENRKYEIFKLFENLEFPYSKDKKVESIKKNIFHLTPEDYSKFYAKAQKYSQRLLMKQSCSQNSKIKLSIYDLADSLIEMENYQIRNYLDNLRLMECHLGRQRWYRQVSYIFEKYNNDNLFHKLPIPVLNLLEAYCEHFLKESNLSKLVSDKAWISVWGDARDKSAFVFLKKLFVDLDKKVKQAKDKNRLFTKSKSLYQSYSTDTLDDMKKGIREYSGSSKAFNGEQAIYDYTRDSKINAPLRGKFSALPYNKLKKSVKNILEHPDYSQSHESFAINVQDSYVLNKYIKDYMTGHKTTSPITLWRGVYGAKFYVSVVGVPKNILKLTSDDDKNCVALAEWLSEKRPTFISQGFCSTSTDEAVARSFSGEGYDNELCTVMKIAARPGTYLGMDVSDLAYELYNNKSYDGGQKEFLFGTNQKFQIEKANWDSSKKIMYLELKTINNSF